jgi:hypothetical protein
MVRMLAEQPHWRIPLMDFVDDIRRSKDRSAIAEPFDASGDPWLAPMLAAVIEHLCLELGWGPPAWLFTIPPTPRAWFVSGIESLKAIALVESPAAFRARRIFVLANFLHRA